MNYRRTFKGLFMLLAATLMISGCQKSTETDSQDALYVFNKAPLAEQSYAKLPVGAIEPRGWLKKQLELQANGITGNLDEVWEDVGPDNGWLGGNGDSWERGPYWLDGLLPLAYTLEDQKLIDKAEKWVEWTLQSQSEDGFFGPRPDTSKMGEDQKESINRREEVKKDWWPRMVMLKVLQQYYEATGDERVIEFMTNYFKYQLKHLPEQPLGNWTHWAKTRGGENLASVYWLYNRTGDQFLLELGELIYKQTRDWTGRLNQDVPGIWHGVNTGMGVKTPAVYYQYAKADSLKRISKTGIEKLMRHHGQIEGLFSGDELLHGTDPLHGTELCTVVEYAYSLESLFKITGDFSYADRLERVIFNALPAQMEPDYTGRQYYQMPNQIAVTQYDHQFTTRHWGTNLYGLETGYGCCTANLHQGWPKFTSNMWMATSDRGLAAVAYAPSKVTAKVADGQEVTITEETEYPFNGTVNFTIESETPVHFPLHLRVPGWADSVAVRINGKYETSSTEKEKIVLDKEWESGDRVILEIPFEVRISRWHNNSAGIEYGPLAYGLKLNSQWKQIEDKKHDFPKPYKTYEVYTDDPWNYGITREAIKNPSDHFKVIRKEVPEHPFTEESAPIIIKTDARRIPQWKAYNGIAGPLMWSNVKSDEPVERISLIPYGSTTLRISEFPVTR